MILESKDCFKFCMFSGSKAMVLDIYNRGKMSHLTHLVSKKYFSGHSWFIKPVRATTGFAISTHLLGATVWLDVAIGGEFDGLLILATKENYSGRIWQIKDNALLDNYYSIATLMDGELKYMDIRQEGEFENMAYLACKKEFSGNYWKFEKAKQDYLECA